MSLHTAILDLYHDDYQYHEIERTGQCVTLEDSERDLTKVVCSCGRKGFIMIPPRTRSSESVDKIAALTCTQEISSAGENQRVEFKRT